MTLFLMMQFFLWAVSSAGQSISFTPRGSGVRISHRLPKKINPRFVWGFFLLLNLNFSNTPCKKDTTMHKTEQARQLCLEVEKIASKYNLPFFFVTDGASITRNNNCKAVSAARQSHIKWEKQHNIDSNDDWSNQMQKNIS